MADRRVSSPVEENKKVEPVILLDAQATNARSSPNGLSSENKLLRLAEATKFILEVLGEDIERPGLQKTPMRVAKALTFLTRGYGQTIDTIVNGAVFEENCGDDLILVKDIEIASMCEHHMVPIIGKVHIGYIPDGKIIGLSKLSRIADMFAQRLQVQERLTKQIAEALMEILEPKAVGVVIEAT